MAPKPEPKPKPAGIPVPTPSAASSSAIRATPGARPAQSMVPSRGRGTGAKLLFRPVMPQRRKPVEPSVKPETSAASSSIASSSVPRGRGTGRGSATRGRGDGRGRGRGGPPDGAGRSTSFAPVEMIATGPFAQGSGALSRSSGSSRGGTSLSAAPSWAAAPTVKTDAAARSAYRDPDKLKEREEYSDTEGDVEIIDMDEVHTLDEMAPRAPPRMREKEEKRKAKERSKKALQQREAGDKRAEKFRTVVKDDPEPMPGMDQDDDDNFSDDDKDEARGADALDLSASEDEEVMDDLLDDFLPVDEDDGPSPENRLYLFQFPTLFPKFIPAVTAEPSSEAIEGTGSSSKARRSVAFAEDAIAAKNKEVKKESGVPGDAVGPRPEGQAGRLELYKDGRVAMRFGEVVMEVTGASQATFLQQVMVLDADGGGSSSSDKKRAVVLGELVRKFVVSPEVDRLLHDATLADTEAQSSAVGEGPITLD